METNSFPFNIGDIAALLNLAVRHRNNRSMDVDCPLCQKKGKLNLNFEKNVFRCNYCGRYGGMVALYAMVYNIENGEAYREICEALKCQTRPREYTPPPTDLPHNEVQLAPLDDRHQTYLMLFSMLTLSKTHKENLLNRGLTDEQIYRYGYKSTPAFGITKLADCLIDSGCTVEGVPGFYRKDGRWVLNFNSGCSGIVIPVISMDGKIQSAQIRLDRPINNRKYIWFSSTDKDGGSTAGSPIHYAGNPFDRVVYITEGALKATVAHCLSGKSFAAIAGVNQYAALDTLLSQLKMNGTEEIVETYDMDKLTNEHVENGCQHLIEACAAYGFKVHRLKWDAAYKGIDDFLASKKKRAANDGTT